MECVVPWSSRFEDAVKLPDGTTLRTLKDARDHLADDSRHKKNLLTEGQGRALSAHKTQQSYAGYAKRTEARMLSATRKRYEHRLANETATTVQNEPVSAVQNGEAENAKSA